MPEVVEGLYLNPSDGNQLCFGSECDCSVYALYMSNCFGGYNNNMRIYINGIYLGDFPAAKSVLYWDGPQNGAAQQCSHGSESFLNPPFGEGPDPAIGAGDSCGGKYGRLFFLNQPSPISFPTSIPAGSRWSSASLTDTTLVTTWHDVPITQGLVPIGEPTSYDVANVLDMYFYLEDFHGGVMACCDDLGNKLYDMPWPNGCPAGTELNPIYTCTNSPSILKTTAGGCLGIIRYKKQDNKLTCPKFLPLKELDVFRNDFVNTFPATTDNEFYTQFTFFWWDEAAIPVSNDPSPSWVENQIYYW
jgi:hypothetical protein